jgi:hypothetical protein
VEHRLILAPVETAAQSFSPRKKVSCGAYQNMHSFAKCHSHPAWVWSE